MSTIALIQFGLSVLAAFLGGVAGWWFRGHPAARTPSRPVVNRKKIAADVLQSLHAAAETLRACIEQHTECMRTIQAELSDATSTEPAVITSAAKSIIASSGLVQHQMDDIQSAINDKRREIRDNLNKTDGLVFTFASLDQQKHVYRQVLSSLEVLAAELAGEVKGHGQRLSEITGELTGESCQSAESVSNAVSKILDATDDVQRKVATTEKRIVAQADTMEMQAILTHTDLLTSLPNRRALETEIQRQAQQPGSRAPICTVMLIDMDEFANVNRDYGHQGGDVILRQAAGHIKQLVRGRDLVARFGGDTFAVLLNQTTLHDALPLAERVRKTLEETPFSQGSRPLRLTASIGVAQLHPEELTSTDFSRVEQALDGAQKARGNVCYRHDGQECHRVSSAFQAKQQQNADPVLSLAALWNDSSLGDHANAGGAGDKLPEHLSPDQQAILTGRSLFAANLGRRLSEWKRGGAGVSVAVVRVDQMDELVDRFGEQGHAFLRQVLGRLLEAATREMDERCEFEDGLLALLLPSTDKSNALAVAERLRSQVRQCKVRMGRDLWDLTASIGVAHCTVAARVMDIMLSAESAMNQAIRSGGDAVCVGEPIQEPLATFTS